MDCTLHITSDPQIMHGAVCFRGTRIPVSVVLDNLAAGETPERIVEQYPSLQPEHIPAALGYAADLARERIVPIPAYFEFDRMREELARAFADMTEEQVEALVDEAVGEARTGRCKR